MSEESGGERGLLTDIFIFVVIVGLGLTAIYLTGHWPWFLKILNNLLDGIMDFSATFTENIKSVSDVSGTVVQEAASL